MLFHIFDLFSHIESSCIELYRQLRTNLYVTIVKQQVICSFFNVKFVKYPISSFLHMRRRSLHNSRRWPARLESAPGKQHSCPVMSDIEPERDANVKVTLFHSGNMILS